MHLLLLGATGLVGKHVLDLALADPRVTAVTAPTRRALPQRPGLSAPSSISTICRRSPPTGRPMP